ncbi:modular protein [Pectobacterium actinidiae]|uniref:Modular protein n=1 Tax=Pectobacterium actinidiae TaxID=1507808 RepID=A0A1V2R2P2_9GAMM|nr:sulfotransferase [Pectobacterium actinidiae]KHN91899.1 putative modular protein [Pectobacterium actinidiae]ONK03674.1 modular protein [Pectobacterium actinidiae]ONK05402.1 modular protein [Pectobacterium actinidiae]
MADCKSHVLTSNPVLLGGENRSGTTLLSVILDSHSDLVVGPELDFTEPVNLGPHILNACNFIDINEKQLIGATKESIDPEWFDGVHFIIQCERFGLNRDDLRNLVNNAMSACDSDLTSLDDRCYLINLIGELRRQQTGAKRWGLKLQRRIKDVRDYATIWPNADFIHILRDGRDLAASHLKTVPEWGYQTIEEAAYGWLEIVANAHRSAPNARYQEIRYEDLVMTPQIVIKQMIDFIGLEWDDGLLRHSDLAHSLFEKPWGHPSAESASKPVYTGRNGRYRQDLTQEQIEKFELIAGKELQRLGYSLAINS